MDILVHSPLVPYIERKPSIQPIAKIFTAMQQNDWKKTMEPIKPVHAPWIKLWKDSAVTWKPQGADVYTGSGGGGLAAASTGMKEASRKASSLDDLFLFIGFYVGCWIG